MNWVRISQFAWSSSCSKYTVSAAQIDGQRYAYSAWHVGAKPAIELGTFWNPTEARAACQTHADSVPELHLAGTTTEREFGGQRPARCAR